MSCNDDILDLENCLALFEVGCCCCTCSVSTSNSLPRSSATNEPFDSSVIYQSAEFAPLYALVCPSMGIAFQVWPSAITMCQFLEIHCRNSLRTARAIELGAGTGIVGIFASHFVEHVHITDLACALPCIMRNIAANDCPNMSVSVGILDWFHPPLPPINGGNNNNDVINDEPPHERYDLILASDVIYWENLIDPFVKTLVALSHPDIVIYIAYLKRSNRVHRKCLRKLRRYFAITTVFTSSPSSPPHVESGGDKSRLLQPSVLLLTLLSVN
jgi:predicted nicotinamide N-methyase